MKETTHEVALLPQTASGVMKYLFWWFFFRNFHYFYVVWHFIDLEGDEAAQRGNKMDQRRNACCISAVSVHCTRTLARTEFDFPVEATDIKL